MSAKQAVVERYVEGFRRGDREMVLSCLTDDVEWRLHGHRSLTGKTEFAGEIQNDATTGAPELTIERMIEDEDLVVALGAGQGRLSDGGRLEFVFADAFYFDREERIRRVDSYLVNLNASEHYFDGAPDDDASG